jgi:hypothetical protein
MTLPSMAILARVCVLARLFFGVRRRLAHAAAHSPFQRGDAAQQLSLPVTDLPRTCGSRARAAAAPAQHVLPGLAHCCYAAEACLVPALLARPGLARADGARVCHSTAAAPPLLVVRHASWFGLGPWLGWQPEAGLDNSTVLAQPLGRGAHAAGMPLCARRAPAWSPLQAQNIQAGYAQAHNAKLGPEGFFELLSLAEYGKKSTP